MNPTLAEDIMRQRAHRSVIVLATLLAWLLVTPDRASAEGFTVIVPVDVTGLHPDITDIRAEVMLTKGGSGVGLGIDAWTNVVDQSVQEDLEVVLNPLNDEFFDADGYRIVLSLLISPETGGTGCKANAVYPNGSPCGPGGHAEGKNLVQGLGPFVTLPISDLTPE